VGGRSFGAWLRSSWPWLLLVAFIVTASAGLRFWELGRQGLWFDELFSANAVAFGPRIAIQITAQDTNPPLYYVLQSLLVPALGRSEWAMRVLPAISGVFATLVMFLAGQTLFDRRTGAWAAAMFAVSTIALQYAQEARMYSLLMLFGALVLWVFGALLERPTWVRAVLLGVLLACLGYTHVYGYMAAPMLLVPVLLLPNTRQRVGRYIAASYTVAAVLFLPWALAIPSQVELVRSQASEGAWWISAPDSIIGSLITNLGALSPDQRALPGLLFGFLLIAAVFVWPSPQESDDPDAGAASAVPELEKVLTLVVLGLLPLVAGLVISKYVTPVATTRNSLVCLPALYVLAARGGTRLWKPYGVIALAAMLLLAATQVPDFYTWDTKGRWGVAARTLTADPKVGVLVQEWETAFNIDTYAKILGREESLDALWINSPDEQPDPLGRKFDEETQVTVPMFLEPYDVVWVVSKRAESTVADYMDQREGWALQETRDLGVPVLRRYVWVGD